MLNFYHFQKYYCTKSKIHLNSHTRHRVEMIERFIFLYKQTKQTMSDLQNSQVYKCLHTNIIFNLMKNLFET